ncbi:hypothetical protein DFH27DRAFT_126776 [Peziza echinospora]|nr:hypothetical protein DFH27DRAFT_54714 [Peziza echinospora]KAI5795505.1 hypothetical protein DFH27DRAFT_126776 [Peziza echinospora]
MLPKMDIPGLGGRRRLPAMAALSRRLALEQAVSRITSTFAPSHHRPALLQTTRRRCALHVTGIFTACGSPSIRPPVPWKQAALELLHRRRLADQGHEWRTTSGQLSLFCAPARQLTQNICSSADPDSRPQHLSSCTPGELPRQRLGDGHTHHTHKSPFLACSWPVSIFAVRGHKLEKHGFMDFSLKITEPMVPVAVLEASLDEGWPLSWWLGTVRSLVVVGPQQRSRQSSSRQHHDVGVRFCPMSATPRQGAHPCPHALHLMHCTPDESRSQQRQAKPAACRDRSNFLPLSLFPLSRPPPLHIRRPFSS